MKPDKIKEQNVDGLATFVNSLLRTRTRLGTLVVPVPVKQLYDRFEV